MRAGLNVLVSGGTQAGKTTLLNALAGAIPARERVISCEEVFELRLVARDCVAMQMPPAEPRGHRRDPAAAAGQGGAADAADRLLVGEVREAEALDLLIALNAGVPAMCTHPRQLGARGADEAVHAAAARGRERVATGSWCPPSRRPWTSWCTSASTPRGRRQVREIVAVPGRVEQGIVETADVFHRAATGAWSGADGLPHRTPERFARVGHRPGRAAATVGG